MTGSGERAGPAPSAAETRDAAARSARKFVALLALCLILFAGFVSLGVWQVHRRAWKLALIERVDHRVHAAPVSAPGPDRWPGVTADRDAYRHVQVTGHYLNGADTFVQASTELGPGFWVITPFRTARGFTVLINRGFVPPERRDPRTRAAGQIKAPVVVTGLLRITEPGGALLRHNDPEDDRWYSRDVAAIARARHLGRVAPYFIDADRTAGPAVAPVGGLTVIAFRNAHLQYAITWFALAVLSVIGAGLLIRDRRRTDADQAD